MALRRKVLVSIVVGIISGASVLMLPTHVADLYSRVNVGTKVIVLPMDRRADSSVTKRG